MNKASFRFLASTALALLAIAAANAQPAPQRQQDRQREQTRELNREQLQQMHGDPVIFGSELMTERERLAMRQRMRSAGSPEERERIRAEHHAGMQARARERGVTLPDEAPMRHGRGMGIDSGPGPGMGQGMGRGRGTGKGGESDGPPR